MAEIFRNGADLHRETAAGIFSKPASEVTDDERQVGKKMLFSLIYGGGIGTLMRQGVADDPKHAMRLLKAFHGTWPGIGWSTKWQKAEPGTLDYEITRRIESRGYITTLYGRHLRPHSPHVRINALCQGCASDLMKWAMVECHQGMANMRSHIVLTVHDELIFDCAAGDVPGLVNLIPQWMTDPRIQSVVPITPSCDISWDTWATKEPYVGQNSDGGHSSRRDASISQLS